MDPIAIANSAIGVLQKVKQALDECKEAFEEAKGLRKAVDLFEVTIMMIPNKAQASAPKSSSVLPEVGRVGSALTGAQDAAMERVEDVISGSPFGVVLDLFKLSPTGEPIFGDGPSPSDVLQEMKNTKIDDIRVYSDLEVMFAGMAFIIKSALESMSDATETLQAMNNIGEPSYLWLCTPWKIAQMKSVKENLAGHFDSLAKQTVALQSAIGVASYAVQLEQLENTLDATSVLTNLDMRDLWKKKLGIDRTRVPFGEFIDAFLSSVRVKVKEARTAYTVEEKVGRFRAPCDVVLGRFLNELYNEDNDDYISAFELSHALDSFVPKGRKSVPHTTDHLLRKEVEFLNFIKFQIVPLPDSLLQSSRNDPLSGLTDAKRVVNGKRVESVVREGTVYPYAQRADKVILVRPFHRLLLRADVPVMDYETFPYDHLIMLKYRWNPILKPGAEIDDDVDEVSEVKHSKTYVHLCTNEVMLGRRDTAWNAFRNFVRVQESGDKSIGDSEEGEGGGGKEVKEGGEQGREDERGEHGREQRGEQKGGGGGGGGGEGEGEGEGEQGGEGGGGGNTRGGLVKKSVVPPGFSDSSNFEEIDREELLISTGGGGVGGSGGGVSAKFKTDPFITPTRILYVPFLLEPGYYSPRFCVDAYDGDARNKQKMAKSAKSYYRSFSSPLSYCATTDEVKKAVSRASEGGAGFGCDEKEEKEENCGFGWTSGGGSDEANIITAREAAYNENARISAYNSKLGVLVKCLDVLELVFAEDIALESQFHEDGDDSDNDNDNDNGDIVQKSGFRPQLSRYYPYLPDRELENYAPMDVEVYVNIPTRRGNNSSVSEYLTFVPTKIALFLCPGELIMEKSVKVVSSRTKRYKYSKSLLKEVVEGRFGGDTGITAISFLVGFVDESGKKRLLNSPAVTLKFDIRAEEEEEEFVEEWDEEGLEDEGDQTPVNRAAETTNKSSIYPTLPSSRTNTTTAVSPHHPNPNSNPNPNPNPNPTSHTFSSTGSSKGGVSYPRTVVSSSLAIHTGHTASGSAVCSGGSSKASSPRAVAPPAHSSGGGSGSGGNGSGGGVNGGSSKHHSASPRGSLDRPTVPIIPSIPSASATPSIPSAFAVPTIPAVSTAPSVSSATSGPGRVSSFRGSAAPSAPRAMAPPSRPGSVKTNNNTTNNTSISNATNTTTNARIANTANTANNTNNTNDASNTTNNVGEQQVENEVSVKMRVERIESSS